jgi:hypothetical protein
MLAQRGIYTTFIQNGSIHENRNQYNRRTALQLWNLLTSEGAHGTFIPIIGLLG